MLDTALKYIKICTSNTCKGKVSGHVNESLRRETFSFCQGQMNVWLVQQPGGRRLMMCRCSDDP